VEPESSTAAARVAKKAMSSFTFSSLHCHEVYQLPFSAGRVVRRVPRPPRRPDVRVEKFTAPALVVL
jgi:hypothetical protein